MPNNEEQPAVSRADVNARLKRMKIRGNEYVTVAQRVQGFWECFPNGRITTEFLVLTKEWAVCRATVWDMDTVLATGTAYEEHEDKGTGVNATSYIENCETSAVGRALGLAGIGSVESISSADESARAFAQQDAKKAKQSKPQPKQAAPEQPEPAATGYDRNTMRTLFAQARQAGIDAGGIVQGLKAMIPGKESLDYTAEDYATACRYIQSVIDG